MTARCDKCGAKHGRRGCRNTNCKKGLTNILDRQKHSIDPILSGLIQKRKKEIKKWNKANH